MTRKSWFLPILIVILAGILRLSFLADFPTGFTADEAAQGYTAYSILETGKDEWGVRLPLTPRSFGDFKPPLYTYLTVPSIAIFGLNEFAVRLPAVVLGALSVLFTYLLVQKLFSNFYLSLLSALFLAISPWHISLSRGAFEANLTTFLLPAGFLFFMKGLRRSKFLLISALLFGLNLFTYHSARFVTPFFVGFLIWWFLLLPRYKQKNLLLKQKNGWIALFIFGSFSLLALGSLFFGGGTRASDIGIFSAGFQAPKLFIDHYLSYLSWEFLFTKGAGEAAYGMIPGRGALHLFELPLLIFAFVALTQKWNKGFLPILTWVLLAPLPAALSSGVGYHANRVAIIMPAIQIFSAYGLIVFFNWIPKWRKVVIFLVGTVITVSFSLFVWNYFRQAPKISAPAMSYGWKEAMNYISGIENNYQKVIVSRRFSEPQTFVAFYKKWEPADFQKKSQDWLRYQREGFKFVDQLGKYSLGKYEFRNINWIEDKNLTGVLFVGKEEDFPQDGSLTKRIIPYPNGQPAFLIVVK